MTCEHSREEHTSFRLFPPIPYTCTCTSKEGRMGMPCRIMWCLPPFDSCPWSTGIQQCVEQLGIRGWPCRIFSDFDRQTAKLIKSVTKTVAKVQGTGHDQLHIYTCRWIRSFTCRVDWKIDQTWQNDTVNSCIYYQVLTSSTPCSSAKGAAWNCSQSASLNLQRARCQMQIQSTIRREAISYRLVRCEFDCICPICTHLHFQTVPASRSVSWHTCPLGWEVENQAATH